MHPATDLICLSHLRWGFVFQRPNHLMSRMARSRRCFFVEEPLFDAAPGSARMELSRAADTLYVCVPHVPPDTHGAELATVQRSLLDRLIAEQHITCEVLWFYTPMALAFARHLAAPIVVYDCMDELSGFAGAPPELREHELELFQRADLVFTGGHSLYQAKRQQHPRVHAFPSSVDAEHFTKARTPLADPPDQAALSRPRLGYFGVIDERLDLDLLAGLADSRPDWHIVMLGPIVKIDPATLPQRPNIHWLGRKDYAALPAYLGNWDVALMPFALNDATKFISPTKTLEYLAAGKPVVSTAITDVVQPYGAAGVVRIADPQTFVDAVSAALADQVEDTWVLADPWVRRTSWDSTYAQMADHLTAVRTAKRVASEERDIELCSII